MRLPDDGDSTDDARRDEGRAGGVPDHDGPDDRGPVDGGRPEHGRAGVPRGRAVPAPPDRTATDEARPAGASTDEAPHGPTGRTPSDVTGTGETDTGRTTAGGTADQTASRPGVIARMPLWAKLVSLISTLLVLGSAVTGVATLGLLRQSMVQQIDAELNSSARDLVNAAFYDLARQSTILPAPRASGLPSDYYVAFFTADGTVVPVVALRPDGTAVPSPAAKALAALSIGDGPVTIEGEDGAQWRAIAREAVGTLNTLDIKSVAIALPLNQVQDTVASMQAVILITAIAVVALGSVGGFLAVRHSLRPLRQIEATAARIADGDLSERVPALPETTEVGRLAASLNSMLAQIEAAFSVRTASEARMRRFVADASHELRTPLAAVRGYGELYRMGAIPVEDVPDAMRRIESEARRMGSLVEDLLQLTRMDEGRPLRRRPVDLTTLAADAVVDLSALDPGRPARVEALVPGHDVAPCVVLGDEDKLRQVVANLVGNVVRHTPAGSPVEIAVGELTAEDGTRRGVVEVRDHGPGIDPEHATRVFERFYRVDDSRTRDSGGAGLGMAIVAAIVTAHDGEVGIERTPGGGATVRFCLPAAG